MESMLNGEYKLSPGSMLWDIGCIVFVTKLLHGVIELFQNNACSHGTAIIPYVMIGLNSMTEGK